MNDLLTTHQLEEILKVDRITIYRMLGDGRLRGFQVGGQWRFPRSDVESWIRGQCLDLGPLEIDKAGKNGEQASRIFPMSCIQAVQSIFADAMDIATVTTDTEGHVLTEVSNGCDFCQTMFFDRREPNGRKVFWSRGNGWVLAGLARVLQYLPPDYAGRARFVALFQEMAQRIAGLQGPDGYWRASLLDPDSRPIPETSGTGFFTYALAWGVNAGLLGHEYEPVVRRGWSALVGAVQPGGMLGYVQQVGAEPGYTGPDQTEIYGSGALLLAGSEVYRLSAH